MEPKDEAYIPRTSLGFSDHRRFARFDFSFTDEAKAENTGTTETGAASKPISLSADLVKN